MVLVSLFLFFAGNEFFKESASPLSAAAEKVSSALFTFLTDYQSFPSSGKWGVAGFFSLKTKVTHLGFGYSYYFKTNESSPMGFSHFSLFCPVLERPEINFSVRYGFSTKKILFYPQNPYETYKINSGHSLGVYTTVAPLLRKIKPYLLTGFSLTYLKGELVEDIFQRKTAYAKVYYRPKIKLGMKVFFFNLELGQRDFNFAIHYR